MNFERGSEWRKWDLHLHTPSSPDYTNIGLTKDPINEETNKQINEETNKQIIDVLVKNEVSVVAITDHHYIDVKRIQELQKLGEGKITVLPGIEFKAEARGREPVHFIGIFSENCDINDIWIKLQGQCHITDNDRKSKGEESVYCDLADTCNFIHKLGGIVSVHAGSKTNTFENITNSLPEAMAQKTDLVHIIDLFELGKEEDQDGYRQKVFPVIKKILPMIICSDNHKITEYHVKQNCWIKADPTFEGLKQIIYEPTERVRIQETQPQDKPQYQVIDTITINSEKIYNAEIKLNSDLNCIIGGRSTGKSMFLGALAHRFKAYLHQEVPDYIKEFAESMTITWQDESKDIENRKIDYFHQGYMSELRQDIEYNYTLNNKIFNIFMQYPQKKQKYDEYLHQSQDIEKNTALNIVSLFTAQKSYQNSLNTVQSYGNKATIQKEIETLEVQLTNIHSINEEEHKLYQEYTQQLFDIEQHLKSLYKKTTDLSQIKQDVEQVIPQTIVHLENFLELKMIFDKGREEFITKFIAEIDKNIATISTNIQEENNKHSAIEINSEYLILSEKIKERTEYENINLRIKEQKELLMKITELENTIVKNKTEIDTIKKLLLNQYNAYYTIEKELADELKDEKSNLIITSTPVLNKDSLIKELETCLLATKTKKESFIDEFILQLKNKSSQIETNAHQEWTKKVLDNVLEENITSFRQGKTEQDLLQVILKHYYDIKFILEYEDDKYENMSEGKQAFVILKLILEFNNDQYPLLIDQPEDDLDNRSIYDELVHYIKDKKKHRQIILVTHNPNIVVSADAEEVIVANQHGSKTKNTDNKKFQYLTGSLENTKTKDNQETIILFSRGIREHVCEVLEGGEEAFEKRQKRYQMK